ncbi:MAG: hypothetical protein Q8K60_01945 [Parachlamydiaceae bacterium]|nr:hypothetical protein [Parachlamydiaceae bacterium]
MTITSIDSIDELKNKVSSLSVDDFKLELPTFTHSQIGHCFVILQNESSSKSKKKMDELFKFIDHPSQLEQFGKSINLPSWMAIVDYISQHPSYHHRLSNILVGLNPSVFFQSLFYLNEDQLTLLKHESIFEPLKYHLNLYIHECEKQLAQIDENLENLKIQFLSNKNEQINENYLQESEERLIHIKDQLFEFIECIQKVLSIVWNTNRVDLIDKLSSLNESYQHRLNLIGQKASSNIPAAGIFDLLDKSLSSLYDNASLTDQDSAMEGLTRLNIWHLEDYWKLGLLPSIKKEDVDQEQFKDNTQLENYQRLLSLVQKQLKVLGIETVRDLKKARIYSQSLLKKYIDERKSNLL